MVKVTLDSLPFGFIRSVMGEATGSYLKISTKIKERGANQRTSQFSLMSRPQTTSSPDDQMMIRPRFAKCKMTQPPPPPVKRINAPTTPSTDLSLRLNRRPPLAIEVLERSGRQKRVTLMRTGRRVGGSDGPQNLKIVKNPQETGNREGGRGCFGNGFLHLTNGRC